MLPHGIINLNSAANIAFVKVAISDVNENITLTSSIGIPFPLNHKLIHFAISQLYHWTARIVALAFAQ